MTHTPGEWKFVRASKPNMNEENNHLVYNEQKRHIAEVFQYQNHDFSIGLDEAKANACLIAAAPRMIKGLQRAEQTIRNIAANLPPDQDLATIAINEATNLRADITAAEGKE